MVFAELVQLPGHPLQLQPRPASRFLVVEGRPVRHVAPDGTLLGVRRFIWGRSRLQLRELLVCLESCGCLPCAVRAGRGQAAVQVLERFMQSCACAVCGMAREPTRTP